MRKFDQIWQRFLVIQLLLSGLIVCCTTLYVAVSGFFRRSNGTAIAICGLILIGLSLYLSFSWKTGRVRMRWSPVIERNSDSVSYWLAMAGFFLIDLALLYIVAAMSYLAFKYPA